MRIELLHAGIVARRETPERARRAGAAAETPDVALVPTGRVERRFRRPAAWVPLLALAASACVPVGLTRDLAEVVSLARLDGLKLDEVETQRDARALLAKPLDADAAVRVALLRNRELRARLVELGIPRGRLIQAGLLPNPTLEAELLPERNTGVELRVEYDLTSLLLVPLRKGVAAAELEVARLEAAAAIVQLGYEVRTAFFGVQAAVQQLAVARRSLDAVAAGRDAAQALLDSGGIAAIDASRQLAAYERTRIVTARYELEAADRRERLSRLLGLHGDALRYQVDGVLRSAPQALGDFSGVETRALRASLELSALRGRMLAAARRQQLARVQGRLPDVSLDVHVLYGRPEEPTAGAWGLGGGISLKLPLFDRQQGNVRAARAELHGATARFEGLAVDVRSAAREARNRLSSAFARARHLEKVVLPAQARLTRETLRQYNAMQLGVFQLLEARREELDAELTYIDTLRELWSARAALDALLAGKRVASAGIAAATSVTPNMSTAGGH